MEWENYPACVDPTLQILEQLLHGKPLYPPPQLELLDMRFFKMFFWSFACWEKSEDDVDGRLQSVVSSMKQRLREVAQAVHPLEMINWEQFICDLQRTINELKQHAKEVCFLLLGGAYKCKSYPPNETLFLEYGRETASFVNFVHENLESLNSKIHPIAAPVKKQIDFISEKLKLFGKSADFEIIHGITRVKNLRELMSQTRTWANHISCLACLYWIDGMDESLASTMGTMLSNLMHKTMPYISGVVASFFEVDSPEEDSKDRELISGQIYAIINELPSLASSIHYDEMKEGNSETKLSHFLQKIARVKAEIRQLYAMTPHSSQLNTPRTNAIGFLDSLLQKLKKMLEGKVNFIASVKNGIQIVWEELALFRPFLQNNMELQNVQEELKALQTRGVNVVYYAAYVTNLCPAQSFSVWYGIVCLPSVIEEIKLIKTQLKQTKDHQMCKNKMLSAKMASSNALPPQATTSKIEGAFVGFKEDVRSIIDHLVRGQENLTIISISGMPGQGKTTLAKKIYNDPLIKYRFHKMVWCYVSKECKIRDLIIHIVRDVSKVDVEDISHEDSLAPRLWKSLKGKRYLIVMDDIWDVGVWHQMQGSFPNDKNGSRILFTSRNHNLAYQTQRNFISYPLRLFSEEESWDLIKEKVFHNENCPPEFLKIGKQIAICCKRLPLAVALIASLLGNIERKLDLWNQMAENLRSHLASEGCMYITELSYKYLPDHLKSCFLYFGAFPRGENIRAKKLKLLWIGEGFIEENEMRSSEDLAEEYLDNLVSQSLVVVTERSSLGGIKRCNVHDLLYDLCMEKIGEENFLYSVDKSTVVNKSSSSPQQNYNHHRLCIGRSVINPLLKPRHISGRKELPSQVHSLLWFHNHGGASSWRASYVLFSQVFKSFKVLIVLDLENVSLRCDMFPEVMLSNIHLRYLALSGWIKHIPPSIANLWNLEILIIRGQQPLEDPLPDTMWKMESLRRVEISRCFLYFDNFEQSNNSCIGLYNIQTLGAPIILPDDTRAMEFLKRFRMLRKLYCRCEEKDLYPTWLSMFGFLKNLEELKIQHKYFPDTTRLEKMPTFNFPQSLKKLALINLKLPWSAMSTIGKQLPNLEVLKLLWDACWGSSWDLEDVEFSKLRYLKFRELEIEQINVFVGCDTSFPCLEELVVEHCMRLEEIPSSFGDICTLNTIKMKYCSAKVSKSVRQILKQQRDNGNHSFKVFAPRNYGDNDEGEDKAEDST